MSAYSDLVLADAPIHYWRFEETSGTTVAASVGGQDGAVGTGVLLDVSGPSGTGSAVEFPSGSGAITIPLALSLVGGGTVECWVKFTNTGSHYVGGVIASGASIYLGRTNTGLLSARFGATNQNQGSVPLNEWLHIAMVNDGSTTTTYVNGVPINTRGSTYSGSTTEFQIGDISGASAPFTDGMTDEWAIYDYPLTASQVAAHYAGASTETFFPTGTIQTYVAPYAGTYTIEASGAQGGATNALWAKGARMQGAFELTQGQVLKILVGEEGSVSGYNCSGGGGTFVVEDDDTPLLIAGGGGGARVSGGHAVTGTAGVDGSGGTQGYGGTDGSGGVKNASWNYWNNFGGGGGGLLTDGDMESYGNYIGGRSYLNGGAGGSYNGANNTPDGGFGGGGGIRGTSTWAYCAGGGGYSGGGGVAGGNATALVVGGGGGSYNAGTSQDNTAGAHAGDGRVVITPPEAPAATNVTVAAPVLGATAAGLIPTVTAAQAVPVAIASPLLGATASLLVPGVSAVQSVGVAPPVAGATAQAPAPGIQAGVSVAVAAPAMGLAVGASVPAVAVGVFVTVAAPALSASAQGPAPSIATQSSVAIASVTATSTISAAIPNVEVERSTSVLAALGSATIGAQPPQVVVGTTATVVVGVLAAQTGVHAPIVTTTSTVTVTAAVASSTASAPAPGFMEYRSRTVTPPAAHATIQALLPTPVAAQGVAVVVGTLQATASGLTPVYVGAPVGALIAAPQASAAMALVAPSHVGLASFTALPPVLASTIGAIPPVALGPSILSPALDIFGQAHTFDPVPTRRQATLHLNTDGDKFLTATDQALSVYVWNGLAWNGTNVSTAESNSNSRAAMSPDGLHAAHVYTSGWRLYSWNFGTGAFVSVTRPTPTDTFTTSVNDASFSPTSDRLALAAGGNAVVLTLGPVAYDHTLVVSGTASRVAWSPDGRYLAVATINGNLYLFDSTVLLWPGGEYAGVSIASLDLPNYGPSSLTFSPEHLVLTYRDQALGAQPFVIMVRNDGGVFTQVTYGIEPEGSVEDAVYLPSAEAFAFFGARVWLMRDGATPTSMVGEDQLGRAIAATDELVMLGAYAIPTLPVRVYSYQGLAVSVAVEPGPLHASSRMLLPGVSASPTVEPGTLHATARLVVPSIQFNASLAVGTLSATAELLVPSVEIVVPVSITAAVAQSVARMPAPQGRIRFTDFSHNPLAVGVPSDWTGHWPPVVDLEVRAGANAMGGQYLHVPNQGLNAAPLGLGYNEVGDIRYEGKNVETLVRGRMWKYRYPDGQEYAFHVDASHRLMSILRASTDTHTTPDYSAAYYVADHSRVEYGHDQYGNPVRAPGWLLDMFGPDRYCELSWAEGDEYVGRLPAVQADSGIFGGREIPHWDWAIGGIGSGGEGYAKFVGTWAEGTGALVQHKGRVWAASATATETRVMGEPGTEETTTGYQGLTWTPVQPSVAMDLDAYDEGHWFWIRFRADEEHLYAKVWASGEPEPVGWQLHVIDERVTWGWAGVGRYRSFNAQQPSATTFGYDYDLGLPTWSGTASGQPGSGDADYDYFQAEPLLTPEGASPTIEVPATTSRARALTLLWPPTTSTGFYVVTDFSEQIADQFPQDWTPRFKSDEIDVNFDISHEWRWRVREDADARSGKLLQHVNLNAGPLFAASYDLVPSGTDWDETGQFLDGTVQVRFRATQTQGAFSIFMRGSGIAGNETVYQLCGGWGLSSRFGSNSAFLLEKWVGGSGYQLGLGLTAANYPSPDGASFAHSFAVGTWYWAAMRTVNIQAYIPSLGLYVPAVRVMAKMWADGADEPAWPAQGQAGSYDIFTEEFYAGVHAVDYGTVPHNVYPNWETRPAALPPIRERGWAGVGNHFAQGVTEVDYFTAFAFRVPSHSTTISVGPARSGMGAVAPHVDLPAEIPTGVLHASAQVPTPTLFVTNAVVLYPNATVSSDQWRDQDGDNTNLHEDIGEASVDDDDRYARTRANPTGDLLTVALPPTTDPGVTYGHKVRYEIRPEGRKVASMTVTLLQDTTAIATWSHTDLVAGWRIYEQTLTPAQAGAITDYETLRVRVSGQVS